MRRHRAGDRDARPVLPSPGGPELVRPPRPAPAWLPLTLFPILALLLLWPALLGDRVMVPAEYLPGFAPWSNQLSPEAREALPQWNVLQWDGMAEFFPWRLHAARTFQAGQIPLWNPYVLCGTPFLANSQSAPLYPLHFLLYVPIGPELAVRLGWLAFLHLSLAGVFCFLLARTCGVSPGAALVSGAAFELSGFSVAWLALPSFITVTCWIPALLLSLGEWVRGGARRWFLGAAASGGMLLLAGHLQIAFYGLLAAGLLVLWETVPLFRSSPLRAIRQLVGAAGAVALSLALAAPQFLPSLELSRMSHRVAPPSETGYGFYLRDCLPPQNWLTLLVPDYYGLPGRGDFWGYWNYQAPNVMEYAGSIAAPGLLLALLGSLWARTIGLQSGYWILLSILSLLLAGGSPVCRFFYFLVPGFSQSGSPARALVLLVLATAVLAGLGSEVVLRRVTARWTDVLVPLGSSVGGLYLLGAAALLVAQGRLPEISRAPAEVVAGVGGAALQRALLAAAATVSVLLLLGWLLRQSSGRDRAGAAGGVLVAAVAGTLLLLGGPYTQFPRRDAALPPSAVTEYLSRTPDRVVTLNQKWSLVEQPSAVLPPNLSLAYGWRDAQGYDSLYLNHFRRLANALSPRGDASPPENGNIVFLWNPGAPLFPFLGAGLVVSPGPLALPELTPAPDAPPGPPYIYRHTQALPEAYLATRAEPLPDEAALLFLSNLAGADRARTIVVGQTDRLHAAGAAGGPVVTPITVERQGAGRIAVVGTAPAPGHLMLLEGYAPGWRVRLRGSRAGPMRPVRSNVAFQSIAIGPGPFQASWRYEPASFRIGLFLALVGLCALLAAAVGGGPGRPPAA